MTRQIFAAEINFQDAPFPMREKFNDSEKNVKRLLAAFRRRVDEVFVFANRHRLTIYIVHKNLNPLTRFFHEENHMKGYVQFYYNSGESVAHLMATASGLLSVIKGDGQVLAEIRRCYQWAMESSSLGMTLDNTLRRAMDTGKAVRTRTAIDKYCASIVETGIELLYGRVENIHHINFLIIGSGELAQLALEYLTREGISNIAVFDQEEIRATCLAKKFSVTGIGTPSLPDYFSHADVVIGVAAGELDRELLSVVKQASAGNRNRVILDFGMPPNIDPESAEILAEEFYNLDDLRRMHASPLEYFGGVEAAWRMVVKASADFALLLHLLEHSPALNAYLTRQFAMKNSELKIKPSRTLRKMLLFKKSESLIGTTAVKDNSGTKLNVDALADNPQDVVRHVRSVKKFRFLLSDN